MNNVQPPVAVVWDDPRTLSVAPISLQHPGSGEVLVRVTSVGICGTDIAAWHGEDARIKPGTVLGHEIGGVITAIGRGVTDRVEGQAVALDPNLVCEQCDTCSGGSRGACSQRRLMGLDVDGGLRTHLTVAARRTIVVGNSADPRSLALVEPIAVGVHACRRSQLGAGDVVGVIGGGPIGMACAMYAQSLGAAEVWVVEPNQQRRDAAIDRGFLALQPGAQDQGGWDIVLDTVGSQATIAAALINARRGATVCVVGLSHGAAMPGPDQLVRRELNLIGSFCYQREDLETAADLVADQGLQALPVDLVDGLDNAPGAFIAIAAGELGRGKTVLVP